MTKWIPVIGADCELEIQTDESTEDEYYEALKIAKDYLSVVTENVKLPDKITKLRLIDVIVKRG